jgi:hypothetical protein
MLSIERNGTSKSKQKDGIQSWCNVYLWTTLPSFWPIAAVSDNVWSLTVHAPYHKGTNELNWQCNFGKYNTYVNYVLIYRAIRPNKRWLHPIQLTTGDFIKGRALNDITVAFGVYQGWCQILKQVTDLVTKPRTVHHISEATTHEQRDETWNPCPRFHRILCRMLF